jgi:predicted DNA-binding protein
MAQATVQLNIRVPLELAIKLETAPANTTKNAYIVAAIEAKLKAAAKKGSK